MTDKFQVVIRHGKGPGTKFIVDSCLALQMEFDAFLTNPTATSMSIRDLTPKRQTIGETQA